MTTFINDKLCSEAVAALARLANEVGTGPLIRALCRVELRTARGSITAEEIKRALGECADVWPRSVLPASDETETIRKLRGQLNRPLRR